MKALPKKLSLLFSAGVMGGIGNGLTVWLFGLSGITSLLGVTIAPHLATPFIYNKIVWGGIWGLLLWLPIFNKSIVLRGFILSLFPTAIQLFVVFPFKDNKDFMGLALGSLTPLFVILFNFIWGVVAVWWYKMCSD